MEYVPPLGSSGIRARIARIPVCGRLLNRVLEVPSPYCHTATPFGDILAELEGRVSAPVILNIGSRAKRAGRVVNLDILQNGHADVIGDATYMPFQDDSFDLIVNIAVMEHTRAPHAIAAECHRVLKPGGRLYCAVPFFQMYHPDPIDVQRYTITGLPILFKELAPLASGVELGPASSLALTLREFLAILFCLNSRILYNLFQVIFGYATYPIKFLDHFLARNRFAFMIASANYFVGEKRPAPALPARPAGTPGVPGCPPGGPPLGEP